MPSKKVVKSKSISEKSTKSNKIHTKFSDSLFKLHQYFKEIISPDPEDECRYICELCKANGARSTYYSGWREGLRSHLETETHKGFTDKKMRQSLNECIILLGGSGDSTFEEESESENEGKEKLLLSKDKENEFYLNLAQFMIQNRFPFSSTENILNFIKFTQQNYDSQLIERTHISNVTMGLVAKNCIASTLKEKLLIDLKETFFSILVDETSELYGHSYIGLVVRYLEKGNESPTNKVFAVIELGESGTGQSLYQKIRNELFGLYPELKQNLIGTCTDNASNMYSSKGAGFINRLQEDAPHLTHISDLCHCYNLVCEAALEAFPKYIINFITNICSHFSRSSQRRYKLAEIQIKEGCKKPLEVLIFKDIRWLSLTECTNRVLELWKYLEIYFQDSDSDLKELFTEEYLLLAQLLSCLLNKLAYFNKYFQKDTLLYNQVIDKIREGFTIFGQMLLKLPYENSSFEQLFTIAFENPEDNNSKNKLSNDEEFKTSFLTKYSEFKDRIETAKAKIRRGIEKEFFGIAKSFITKAIIKMKNKLPFNHDTLNQSLVIYLEDKEFNIETWRLLGKRFVNVITPQRTLDFEEELERFKIQYSKIKDKYTSPKTSIITTWDLLSEDYPNMTLLARALVVLPYSSSNVESTFSRLKAFVSPYRNCLSAENIEASLLISQSYENKSVEITSEMVLKCSQIWENKSSRAKVPSNEEKKDIPKENPDMRLKLPLEQLSEPDHIDISNFEKLFTHFRKKAITQQDVQSSQLQNNEDLNEEEPQNEFEMVSYEYQANSLKRKTKNNLGSQSSVEGIKKVKNKDERDFDKNNMC